MPWTREGGKTYFSRGTPAQICCGELKHFFSNNFLNIANVKQRQNFYWTKVKIYTQASIIDSPPSMGTIVYNVFFTTTDQL
jgi:hypothetical protein